MHRKPSFWIGLVACIVIATLQVIGRFAPDLFSDETWRWIFISQVAFWVLVIVIYAVLKIRERFSSRAILHTVVALPVLAVIGVAGAWAGSALWYYATTSSLERGGMQFGRADDGKFHVTLMVEGSAVEFRVDPRQPFNVVMPDVLKQIGIDPSSLIYNQRFELFAGGVEYAADVVLPKMQLGSVTIENLPVKVLATYPLRDNILGKPFLDTHKDWRITGDTLIVVQ
jgi:clan AA aspartic protease (TIGR02281 family)